jgi:hypothetical protein
MLICTVRLPKWMVPLSHAHSERTLAGILDAKLDQHCQRACQALDGGAPLIVQQHVNRYERPTLGQGVIRLQDKTGSGLFNQRALLAGTETCHRHGSNRSHIQIIV